MGQRDEVHAERDGAKFELGGELFEVESFGSGWFF